MSYTFKLSRRLAAGHVWGALVLLVLLGACDSESATDESTSGTPASSAGLYAAGQTAGSYSMIARQTGGTLADTVGVTITPTVLTSTEGCPATSGRIVSVATGRQLITALGADEPGDQIRLAAGTYALPRNYVIARSGTPADPIVICGPRTAVINMSRASGLYLNGSWVTIRGLRITNLGTTGFWLRGVHGVVLDRIEIDHGLQELLAFKGGSYRNVVNKSLFHDSGIKTPAYGEAIYVANSGDPGSPLEFGDTANQILHNHFGPNVRAESADLKEGANRTVIRGNYFDGTGIWNARAKMIINVRSNRNTIDSNTVVRGKPMFVAWALPTKTPLSGNTAAWNRIDLQDQFVAQRGSETPYAFQFQAGTTVPAGAIVHCNNVMISGQLSNRHCTP